MLTIKEQQFLERAIALSRSGMEAGHGGPFGCVVVKDDEIVGEGYNQVVSGNDPTAHAEIIAIRHACQQLHTYQLSGCEIYTSCEPCPMCLGAIYWARPSRVIYANTRQEAGAIEFDDDFIYREIGVPMQDRTISFIHAPHPQARQVFLEWKEWEGRARY